VPDDFKADGHIASQNRNALGTAQPRRNEKVMGMLDHARETLFSAKHGMEYSL